MGLSSWESAGPKRTMVDLHYRIGFLYSVLLVLVGISLLLQIENGVSIQTVIFVLLFLTLAIGHFKVSKEAERDVEWVPTASFFLAVPLLLGFPIGTYLAVRLIIASIKRRNELQESIEPQ